MADLKDLKQGVGELAGSVAGKVNESDAAKTPAKVLGGTQPTRKLSGVNFRDANWFKDHTGELENVTAEAQNLALGIESIEVFNPSEGQLNNGVIANVRLTSAIGTISGIQIREGKERDGSIYLTEPSRNIAKAGEASRYMNDVRLNRAVTAQILSFVDSLLVPAK